MQFDLFSKYFPDIAQGEKQGRSLLTGHQVHYLADMGCWK